MGIRVDLGLPRQWESRFLSEEVTEAAAGNAMLWTDVRDSITGDYVGASGDAAAAWAELSQVMVGRIAPVSGIDASQYTTIVDNIVKFASTRPGSVRKLVTDLADTTVGIAVNALGAVPIVGAVVQALDSLVRMLIGVFSNNDVPPPEVLLPFQRYSQRTDEFLVRQAMGNLETFDWDALYRPAFEGDWIAEKIEAPGMEGYAPSGPKGKLRPQIVPGTGWVFRPRRDTNGFGFIPGSQRCTSAIQVWFTEMSERDQRSQSIWALPVNFASSTDTGDFYPGVSQLMTSIDQQCQKAQTQMWNVEVSRIRTWWYDYVRSGIQFAEDIFSGKYKEAGLSKLTVEQREVLARSFVAQLLVSQGIKAGPFAGSGWAPGELSSKTPTVFEEIVEPWYQRMKKRQLHNMGTLAVATASPDGAAFRNSTMRDHLGWMQAALLESKQRWNVNIDNVVDPAFRARLLDSRGGSKFTRPDLAIEPGRRVFVPDIPPDAIPKGPAGGYPGDQPASVWPLSLAATALITLGGWYFLRRR